LLLSSASRGKAAGIAKAGKLAETVLAAMDPVQAGVMAGKTVLGGAKLLAKKFSAKPVVYRLVRSILVDDIAKENDPAGHRVFSEFASQGIS
jgi:hypothetical protein